MLNGLACNNYTFENQAAQVETRLATNTDNA